MTTRALTAVLLLSVSLTACNQQQQAATPYEVEEVPLSQISADLAAGKTTSVAVTQAYLDRIKMYDDALNAVTTVAPDALEQAAAADQRRKDGKSLGPLDGIPILVKDNIDAVGMPNTTNTFVLEKNYPKQDATLIRRLRGAGALILGKVHTGQYAGLRNSTGGAPGVGGVAHNPYDLARAPGGSSSGPTIAAAVSFSAASIGTCTTGSIVSPASLTGTVSVRPTLALVPRTGIIPVSLTQDTAGAMGRNVRDVAMVLTVIAGSDPADPRSAEADKHKTDYAAALSTDSLKGKRLGVMRHMRGYDARTEAVFNEALQVLAGQGAELAEVRRDIFEDISQEDRIILIYDFKHDLNNYLANAPDGVPRSLTEIIAATKADPRENQYGTDLFEAAEATSGLDNPEYVNALAYLKRKTGPEGYDIALSESNASALVVLTTGPAELIDPPSDGRPASHPIAGRKKGDAPPSPSMYASIAGYPNIVVPMGNIDGLPVGLSIIGPAWSEATLLSYAYAYEQASKKRIPPTAYKQAARQTPAN